MASEHPKTPIVVTHDGGTRFTAQIRSHRLSVDQPFAAGGEDTAPMPIELLGASLGTCVALYVQQFLRARHIPYEGMRVEVEQYGARNPNRVSEFIVRIVLPEPVPTPYGELLEVVARSCPAHNTLAGTAHVSVTIETPSRVGV